MTTLRRRTKIVATLGPVSQESQKIEELITAGVDVFRLNFSHGDHDSHLKVIQNIKKIRKKMNRPVAILQDLTGPKIRVGKISDEPMKLVPGDELILDGSVQGSSQGNRIGINYAGFSNDVYEGAKLLLADGDLELAVTRIKKAAVHCKVVLGGELYSHKGVNFPSGTFQIPPLTEKDERDLEFGLENEVDLVAMSFVRKAGDLELARKVFSKTGRSRPLVAKIEKHEAIENLQDIIQAADGIMVARGDLGVEIEIESVPIVQKKIIEQANKVGKPVITATQMLKSMVESPIPTRAEVTDVANAIFEGTDGIMLSEETAIGQYPVKAVEIMGKIAKKSETSTYFYREELKPQRNTETLIPDSISHSATILARDLDAAVIFAVTRTGYTARSIAKFRPGSMILALTPEETVYHQLQLVWGVLPVKYDLQQDQNTLFGDAIKLAKKLNIGQKGQHYVFASGFPLGKPGSINQVNAGKIL